MIRWPIFFMHFLFWWTNAYCFWKLWLWDVYIYPYSTVWISKFMWRMYAEWTGGPFLQYYLSWVLIVIFIICFITFWNAFFCDCDSNKTIVAFFRRWTKLIIRFIR